MYRAYCLILVLLCTHLATGKVYTRCGLTQELLRLDVSRSFVGNFPKVRANFALVAFEDSRGTYSQRFWKCHGTHKAVLIRSFNEECENESRMACCLSGHFERVCLVESESFKDTSKIVNKANGSKGLGLFQISSKEWCRFKTPGGKCNMKCEDLTNEDIKDDVACAKKAIDQLGFQGWEGWRRSCYGRETVTRMPNCPGVRR